MVERTRRSESFVFSVSISKSIDTINGRSVCRHSLGSAIVEKLRITERSNVVKFNSRNFHVLSIAEYVVVLFFIFFFTYTRIYYMHVYSHVQS